MSTKYLWHNYSPGLIHQNSSFQCLHILEPSILLSSLLYKVDLLGKKPNFIHVLGMPVNFDFGITGAFRVPVISSGEWWHCAALVFYTCVKSRKHLCEHLSEVGVALCHLMNTATLNAPYGRWYSSWFTFLLQGTYLLMAAIKVKMQWQNESIFKIIPNIHNNDPVQYCTVTALILCILCLLRSIE